MVVVELQEPDHIVAVEIQALVMVQVAQGVQALHPMEALEAMALEEVLDQVALFM
jgi:hypothetical protein